MSDVDLGDSYRSIRERLSVYARSLDDDAVATNVPGCPLWSVHDVLAHLTGAATDFTAGNFEGAPGPVWTARHVEARRDRSVAEIVDEWDAIAPKAELMLRDGSLPPHAVADIATHEQDVLGALDERRYREDPVITWVVDWALDFAGRRFTKAELPAVRVRTDRAERVVGEGEPAGSIATSDFELIRAIFGRRSRAQLLAMGWSADEEQNERYADALTVFAPSELDVVE